MARSVREPLQGMLLEQEETLDGMYMTLLAQSSQDNVNHGRVEIAAGACMRHGDSDIKTADLEKGGRVLRELDDLHRQLQLLAFEVLGGSLAIPALIDLPEALLEAGAEAKRPSNPYGDITMRGMVSGRSLWFAGEHPHNRLRTFEDGEGPWATPEHYIIRTAIRIRAADWRISTTNSHDSDRTVRVA